MNGCWKCGRYERIKIEKIYSLFNNYDSFIHEHGNSDVYWFGSFLNKHNLVYYAFVFVTKKT